MLKVQKHETDGLDRFLYQCCQEIHDGQADEKVGGWIADNPEWIDEKSYKNETVCQDCHGRNYYDKDNTNQMLLWKKYPQVPSRALK